MKKFVSLVLGLAVLASTLPAHAIRESGGRRAPLAIEVVFASIGSGIDFETKKEILALVEQDRLNRKVTVVQEKTWGREGESTLCVEYTNFQDAHAADVEVQKILAKAGKDLTTAKRKLSCSPDFAVAPNE